MFIVPVKAKDNDIVVTIDAGHGGSDSGATYVHSGTCIYEKNMTLKIAKAMYDELTTYSGVKV